MQLPGVAQPLWLKAEGGGHLNWYAARDSELGQRVGGAGLGVSRVEGARRGVEGAKTDENAQAGKQGGQGGQPKQQQQQPAQGGCGDGSGIQITMAPSRFDKEEFALYQK